MSILKDLAAAATGLLVFFVVSGAFFGDGETGYSRFDASVFDSAIYAPGAGQAAEFQFARGATPADRVNEVFARFVPGEGKLVKRYASAAAVIR
jgi:hypothetical protein